MSVIDDKHYGIAIPLLINLAKRNYPMVEYWYNLDFFDCYICGKDLSNLDVNEFRVHGFNHLKERNLLPFI